MIDNEYPLNDPRFAPPREDDFNALIAKIEELESCLRWYVEEDDTNMTQPGNERWIEGKHRAMRALGMEVE